MGDISERFKKFKRSNLFNFLCFSWITIVGYLIFYLYPVIRTVILSFTDTYAGRSSSNFIGLKNYVNIFLYETNFTKALVNSIVYALTTGVLVLITSLLTAILINGQFKGVGFFRIMFFLPFVLPSFASVEMYKRFFDPNIGFINLTLYNLFGIQGPGWFKSEETAMLTMILLSCWGFGVQMLFFLAALQNIPKELYESADMDGAVASQKLWHITLPMISPIFFLNVILVVINGLKSFNIGYLVGGASGEPNGATLLFPVLIFKEAYTGTFRRLGYASALALIYFFVILAFTAIQFFLKRYYVKEDLA